MTRILDAITSPADLKLLSVDELGILAQEIRDQIISTTSRTGGHVASSLGAVEIILAVHSLIDSPRDRFVFDVGHQAYAHKLVTGRLKAFENLRQSDGVSGFPRPAESPHDVHASGHASDSLSIALGLAKARELRGSNEKIVALIGDAALAGGMAFEALNTIGQLQLPLVIILNDNEMSISRNVGALMRHLGAIRSSANYRQARDTSQARMEESVVGRAFVNFGRNAKDSLKQFFVPDTMMFEQLGILCTPPINGHDISALRDILRTALDADGPVLLHVVTKKGAGYAPAEADPERFHGVAPYDIETGKSKKKAGGPPKYTDVFGAALVREARDDGRIVGITAGMRSGTGLKQLELAYPDRFIDVGIAEENAVGMAAGLALGGMKPVVAIYSTFLQRALDQIIVDGSLPQCDIVYAIDRGGVVGEDGPTHHGIYDMSYLRMIPGMRVLAPSDEAELVHALHTALALGGSVAVRYPRGAGVGAPVPERGEELPVGKARVVREGADVAVLAFGDRVAAALEAAETLAGEGVDVRVVDMRWVKPLDEEAIAAAAQTRLVVTVENGIKAGGAGEGVLEVLERHGCDVATAILAIDDTVVPHGTPNELLANLGLDAAGIVATIRNALA